MKKFLKVFSILILLITMLVPTQFTKAINKDITNQVRIFNLNYSGLPDSQQSNMETMLLDFNFTGEYDASALGSTIQSGDYFTVPFNSKDSNITLANGSYPLLNNEGKTLGTLTTSRQSGILTFTFNDNILGLENVRGTFRVKASAKVVRGENHFTLPDGTEKTVTFSKSDDNSGDNTSDNDSSKDNSLEKSVAKNIQSVGAPRDLIEKLKSGEISMAEYLQELEKYSVSSLLWTVKFNKPKADYGTNNVIIKDTLKIDEGVVLTYQKDSLVLKEVTYSGGTAIPVREIAITTNEQEFVSSNGDKALITIANGGTEFEINLGNNVGTKSYELTYKTPVPEKGFSISNGATFYNDKVQGIEEITIVHKEESVGGTVEGDLISRIRVTKYDADNASILLSNAVFKIAKEDNPDVVVATLVTDEKGVAISDKLEPGNYIVKETTAPDGYRLENSSKLVTVKDNAPTYIAISNNKGETPLPTPETTQVSGTKTWEDNNNQDGKRPEKIKVNLLADGQIVQSKEVSEKDSWKYTFENLPKYKEGKLINYTITEDKVDGYETEIKGYNITNKYTPEKTQVSGTKTWEDNNNQDGKRPEKITVNLLSNGAKVQSKEVSATDNWKYTFENLPKYKEGKLINYTITEDKVDGYETEIKDYNITNKYTPETIQVSGTKTWEDNNNQDGKRPDKITVNLFADGVKVQSKEVSATDNWSYSFNNLPKYKNGKAITYTIEEVKVEGYTSKVDKYNLTNTYTPTTNFVATKIWKDVYDSYYTRPSIELQLYQNGNPYGEKVIIPEVRASIDNAKVIYEWTNLPKYDEQGNDYVYTVDELNVPNEYKKEVKGSTITNTLVKSIFVKKIWEDENNKYRLRPEKIIVDLYADGKLVATQDITESDKWEYEFKDMPSYREDGLNKIRYTVKEREIQNYETSMEEFFHNAYIDLDPIYPWDTNYDTTYYITNKYTPKTTQVSGTKTWEDNNNENRKRPDKITVNLLENGVKVDSKEVSAADNWRYSFNNLPKYKDGKEIIYTIEETEVEGYTSKVDGYNITNKYTPEVTQITGEKTWEDNNNQDGKRPEKIKVNLLADGEIVQSKEVSSKDNWKYTFENLPKYKEGKLINYTITEDKVDGYETEIKGYNITNKYTPEVTQITGEKTWEDNNNQDGKRPEKITVNLLENGVKVDSKEVSVADNWRYSFNNLPKYKDGKEIIYTIEETEVEGYTSKVDGYNITNKYTPEVTQITGEKTWEDNNNQDGKRPEKIKVNLLADGEIVQSKEVSSKDNWKYTFENLPKYKEGKLINYTITEDKVDGYETEIKGYNITNKYTPEKPSIDNNPDLKYPKGEEKSKKEILSKTGENPDEELFGIFAILSSLLVALNLKKRN